MSRERKEVIIENRKVKNCPKVLLYKASAENIMNERSP
jgi:hypothetical protein